MTFRYLSALLISAALLLGSTSGAGPCDCRGGSRHLWADITVHERDVRTGLQAALDKAEATGLVRLAMALSFCGEPPPGIRRTGPGELSWPATGCMATLRGPRPWPELIELECPEMMEIPDLPAGFRLDGPVKWEVSGEELNRQWRSRIAVVTSSCAAPAD